MKKPLYKVGDIVYCHTFIGLRRSEVVAVFKGSNDYRYHVNIFEKDGKKALAVFSDESIYKLVDQKNEDNTNTP